MKVKLDWNCHDMEKKFEGFLFPCSSERREQVATETQKLAVDWSRIYSRKLSQVQFQLADEDDICKVPARRLMWSFVENPVKWSWQLFCTFSFFYEVGSVYFLVIDLMHHKQQLKSFVSMSVVVSSPTRTNSVCQQLETLSVNLNLSQVCDQSVKSVFPLNVSPSQLPVRCMDARLN